MGWRRAFCTVARREAPEAMAAERAATLSPGPSLRSCSKLGFLSGAKGGSNPSTPRLVPTPELREPPAVIPASGTTTAATTPRSRSPALFRRKAFSTPSSPRSPSKFALFKHLSKSRCRICSQSLKASQETPVFTAECSHTFHFPCIAAHVRSHSSLACPVCSAAWLQEPFLSAMNCRDEDTERRMVGEAEIRNPNRRTYDGGRSGTAKGREQRFGMNKVAVADAPSGKVYDDDEPLLLAPRANQAGGIRFNPIPEAVDEDDKNEESDAEELLPSRKSRPRSCASGLQVTVMPQASLLSEGRRHRKYVVAIKVKAPPLRSAPLIDQTRCRAPIDLVTVLDVSQGMTGEKLQMLKRAMLLVVSSLGPADRLSMVAFSASTGVKRLFPLRRMSRQGQRAARRIVERLVVVGEIGAAAAAGGASVGDALRKATKVLEDRRERNTVATIMLLSDAVQQQYQREQEQPKETNIHINDKPSHSPRGTWGGNLRPHSLSTTTTAITTTRFAHLEIPLEDANGTEEPLQKMQVPSEGAFIKCVGGLVSVVMQDVRLQLVFPSGKICAVYPSGGGCSDVAIGPEDSVLRLGDLYAEEERELLVELRVPFPAVEQTPNYHHRLTAKCSYRDPATNDLSFSEDQVVLLPPLCPELGAASLRLRNVFVSTRAVAESHRLAEFSDYATAHHLLSSARALLHQSASGLEDHHLIRNLDSELAELQRRRHCLAHHQRYHDQPREEAVSPSVRQIWRREAPTEVRGEALTPTSAWRAAEQLAKVAIMRKSMNRVSDLHGFENARF
ncbi:E3 ubiquitin-protein ligase WAV3-like [Curcuma longa]|uniref:E3 ubiquitin-protein ligase WAV3-like n=1 Tax=Curcuma longa TaxID=136217 RepID=UPI003D9F8216